MKIKIKNKIYTEYRDEVGKGLKYEELWNEGYGVRVIRILGVKFLVWDKMKPFRIDANNAMYEYDREGFEPVD
jgi:hypothetical protein